MRTISATLLAAQKKADRIPYIEIQIRDFEQGIKRLSWQRLYQGSEPDNHHGLAFDGQGSMHRIRAGADNKLYYQKIPSPGEGSDFSQWQEIATDCYGPCAIASQGARVYIFYRNTSNVLWKYYSHDYGQNWTSAQLVDYSEVSHLAASWRETTSTVVCFAMRLFGGTVQLNAITLDTNTQQATEHRWSDATHSLLQPLGIGATYDPDIPGHALVLAGKESDSPYNHYNLFRTHFSNSGSWTSLMSFLMSPEGEQTTYQFPDCHLPNSPADYETTRIVAIENFTGTSSYTRPLTSHRVKGTAWTDATFTEPKPFLQTDPAYGLRTSSTQDYWWLEKPDSVWRAQRQADDPLIITTESKNGPIISMSQQAHADGTAQPALVLTLDNSKARFASLGQSELASLRFRSEIVLKLGYKTTNGNETSEAGTYWIDGWQWTIATNKSLFTIYAIDGWGLMQQWTARYQMRWNKDQTDPTTVWQILYQLLARAGIRLTNTPPKPQSQAINNLKPDFTIQTGTRGDTAIKRLLSFVPDKLVFRGQEAFTKDPRPDESPCYTYGTDHKILSATYREDTTASRARAIGRDDEDKRIAAEAQDWNLLQLAIDILDQDYDPNLQNDTRAQERAQSILRKHSLGAKGGQITTPANVAQELLDVVTIKDPHFPINDSYRIAATNTAYNHAASRYRQTAWLCLR